MKAYWDSLTKEQQGELAGKVGSTPGYLRLVFNGYKKASFVLAKKLEQCTSGAITKSDLRPDTTIAATYTLTAKVEQANGQVSTKTAESKFVADDKNAVLAASPERVDSLVADGKTTATMTVTLMAGVNPVGGSMWVDIEAPEGVTEKDYQFLPSKADHFSGGKITRTFSTSKPGVYTFTFNALTYGGYEMTPVKVTINAVAAETENGEEEMP